jgi:hypothetical protein
VAAATTADAAAKGFDLAIWFCLWQKNEAAIAAGNVAAANAANEDWAKISTINKPIDATPMPPLYLSNMVSAKASMQRRVASSVRLKQYQPEPANQLCRAASANCTNAKKKKNVRKAMAMMWWAMAGHN